MATGAVGEMKAEHDFRRACGLCFESFRGRTPKLLPCFHTFCLPCLTVLIEKTSSAQQKIDEKNETREESTARENGEGDETVGQSDEGKGNEQTEGEDSSSISDESDEKISQKERESRSQTFACPACRTAIPVPKGGVAELQTNFYLDAVEESRQDPVENDPVFCEMCEEGEQKEAEYFCHHCQQRICRPCRRLHDLVKGARDHHVESVPSKPAPKPAVHSKEKKHCQFHPDQALLFRCCKCDVAICLHCKLTSHEGHETEDMATAALRAKEELNGVLAKANKQLHSLDTVTSRLERDEMDLKRQKQEVIQQINSRYDVLMSWVQRAREEVLETVEAKEQVSLNDILTRKSSAFDFKNNVSDLAVQASRTLSLGPEIVLMKNALQASLLSDESFKEYQELGDRKGHLSFFTCDAQSSALDLCMIRSYIGELREDDDNCTPSISYRDLAAAVFKLQQVQAEMEDNVKCPRVSFHIKMTGSYTYNNGYKVVFNYVLSNEGNGYSSSDGIFTAPEAGTYMFMTTARNQTNGHGGIVALYVKGVDWGRTSPPESSTVHAVAVLNKGDQVWVQSCNSFPGAVNASMFSGALVST